MDDEDTVLLIARLILEDVQEIIASSKGKACGDILIALQSQAEMARNLLESSSDYRFARSLDRALSSDAAYLDAFRLMETGTFDDRRSALALGAGHRLPSRTDAQRALETVRLPVPRPPSPSFRSPIRVARSPASLSSSVSLVSSSLPSLRTGPSTANKRVNCIGCLDGFTVAFLAPCGDSWCRTCLEDLVKAATSDESLFPLRCCNKPLLLDQVAQYVPHRTMLQFRLRAYEYNTPTIDRLYCPVPTCSTFLGSAGNALSSVVCRQCHFVVCPRCKRGAHTGPCGKDDASDLALKALAEAEGWKECPGCARIVELTMGCYHISCRCRAQFCYVCRAEWKTCNCPIWDEKRLFARAQQALDDMPANVAPQVRRQRVQALADLLREDHECRPHNWRYCGVGGQCEECGFTLPRYLMRCQRCQRRVCRRCSLNRL